VYRDRCLQPSFPLRGLHSGRLLFWGPLAQGTRYTFARASRTVASKSLTFHHKGEHIVDIRKSWASACCLACIGKLVCPACMGAVDGERKCSKCGGSVDGEHKCTNCSDTWKCGELKYKCARCSKTWKREELKFS